jgi:hypothetical protein
MLSVNEEHLMGLCVHLCVRSFFCDDVSNQ